MVRTNSSRDNDDKIISEFRDQELENIVGNLFIAEYQVDKLKNRLAERVSSFGTSMPTPKSSTFTFRVNKKYFKVKLDIEEQKLD